MTRVMFPGAKTIDFNKTQMGSPKLFLAPWHTTESDEKVPLVQVPPLAAVWAGQEKD